MSFQLLAQDVTLALLFLSLSIRRMLLTIGRQSGPQVRIPMRNPRRAVYALSRTKHMTLYLSPCWGGT
jgi:hypothetical protein